MARFRSPHRLVASPRGVTAALLVAALLAGLLPGGTWSDSLALFATAAALLAAGERRDRDMVLAIGLATGLAPAGLMLAPLCLGLAIRRGACRHLPGAALAGMAAGAALQWPMPAATLPNLAAVALHIPDSVALVVAAGTGLAAWLTARATTLPPTMAWTESRFVALAMTVVLPLPTGALAFVLALAALPLPAPLRAANDNPLRREPIRLVA